MELMLVISDNRRDGNMLLRGSRRALERGEWARHEKAARDLKDSPGPSNAPPDSADAVGGRERNLSTRRTNGPWKRSGKLMRQVDGRRARDGERHNRFDRGA